MIQELLHEFFAEKMHAVILDVLEMRFGPVPQDVAAAVQAIQEEQRLNELLKLAVGCGDLSLFRARLQSCGSQQRGIRTEAGARTEVTNPPTATHRSADPAS